MPLTLYSYFRSSASWRVRIGLALKALPHDYAGVHLLKKENRGHAALGAAQLVPALELDDGTRLTQSFAILEYLDEIQPEPPLLPREPVRRAQARSLALDIACETHPLCNLRVLRHLVGPLGLSEQQKTEWMQHWMREGLAVVEARVAGEGFSGTFCMGDTPGLADCLLVPQLFNARRFGVDLGAFPHLTAIEARCLALPAFASTAPDQVPDAE